MHPPRPDIARMTRRTGLLAAATALLSGCSGAEILNTLVPDSGYREERDVPYGKAARQKLDIYHPLVPGGAAGGVPPLVVFFYGGSWSSGDREEYRFVGQALASAGAVVVIADYRLSPQVRYPVFVQDCALALAWAFEHAAALGSDARHVTVMGHSAGAYNAAMLALDPRWLGAVGHAPTELKSWIGMAGPYDFLPIGDPATQVAFSWPDTPADSQPLVHANAKAPRTLLMAAKNDKLVDPVRNTQALAAKLRNDGVDVTLRIYERVSHVTLIGSLGTPLRFLAPTREDIVAFLGLRAAAAKPG